ncbi:MAG: hypothetical protein ACREP9_18450, partial [Candidatus Dormibacteraceae bacterium]
LSYHQEALGNAWESYLTHGGFPRAVDSVLKTGDVSEGFAQGMWQIIKGDAIRDNAQINDLQLISFLHRLSQNLASPINASAIGKEIGLGSHHRVLERIEDLCQAFLAWRCCQAQGELPNPAAQWKLYFVDPLLAQLAARLDERYPLPDRSVIAEQQLGLLLLRAVEREVPGSFISSGQVMFERSSSRTEIDFVGPRLGVSFESKYVDTVWRRAARTMELRHGGGVLVTRSRLDLNGPVWVVPAGVLGWLLDH